MICGQILKLYYNIVEGVSQKKIYIMPDTIVNDFNMLITILIQKIIIYHPRPIPLLWFLDRYSFPIQGLLTYFKGNNSFFIFAKYIRQFLSYKHTIDDKTCNNFFFYISNFTVYTIQSLLRVSFDNVLKSNDLI